MLTLASIKVPAQNVDSVSEHAIALYYGIRRHILEMHAMTMDGQFWAAHHPIAHRMTKIPPRVNAEETLVIIGYGALGMLRKSWLIIWVDSV